MMRGRRSDRSSSSYDDHSNIIDLTGIGITTGSSYNKKDSSSSPYLCNFCDVPLIKKMDDIKLLGTKDAGSAVNTRFICPRCGNIRDPLRLGDFDNVKHAEKGQTIRSLSSSEGTPFVEMFNSNSSNTADNNKGSSLKGTQVSKALLQRIIINNDPEPNEEENMRAQGYKMLRTEVSFTDGRKIVKTYD